MTTSIGFWPRLFGRDCLPVAPRMGAAFFIPHCGEGATGMLKRVFIGKEAGCRLLLAAVVGQQGQRDRERAIAEAARVVQRRRQTAERREACHASL